MHKPLALAALAAVSAGALSAPITPFGFYAGYFRGNSFTNHAGNRTHLSGIELGAQQSLVSLPLLGQVDLGASVVLGGSLKDSGSANGNLYRIYAQYKSPSAGPSSVYGIAGFGYYWANGGSFNNQTGLGTEFGIGLPLKTGLPGVPGAAIEARYRMGQRSGTSGFSIGLGVTF